MRAAERLRLLGLITEQTTDAVIVTDLKLEVIYVNPAFELLYGYSEEEFLGRSPRDLRTESVPGEAHPDIYRAVATGVCWTGEVENRRKDGSTFICEVKAFPVRTAAGEIFAYAALQRDVTGRKRVEESLRVMAAVGSVRHGQTFFDSMSTQLASALQADYALIGELHAEQGLESVRTISVVVDGRLADNFDYDLADTPCENVTACGVCSYEVGVAKLYPEDLLLTQMGVEGYVGVPLCDSRGSTLGVMAAMTRGPLRNPAFAESILQVFAARVGGELERLAAEDEIRQLNADLETRVARRTAALEGANEQLEAFAYSVSHDLRAPVRHIGGFARLLSEKNSESFDSESRRWLQNVQDSARGMGVMIDELLELSRLGRQKITRRPVDCDAMVRRVWESLLPEPAESRVALSTSLLPRAHADSTLVEQVWRNLLENAIKYSAIRRHPQVEVSSFERDDSTWYRVRDNGVGFDQRYADKLFGVFQRLHRPDEFPGTGVGLAIVHRIVAQHGGRVLGFGEVDKGATFDFTLGD